MKGRKMRTPILAAVSFSLICYGLFLVWVPLGYLSGGVLVFGLAWASLDIEKKEKEKGTEDE